MGGIISPSGGGTWTMITPVTIGSLALDVADGSSDHSLTNAALSGQSWAMIRVQGYFDWNAANVTTNAFWSGYLSVVEGGYTEVSVVTAQKLGASDFIPDSGAGANYQIVTDAIVPIFYDEIDEEFSIEARLSVNSDVSLGAGVLILNYNVILRGVIAGLAQP